MLTVYFPPGTSIHKVIEWGKERGLHVSFAFRPPQHYPKGISETLWEEIIWGYFFYLPV